MLGPRGAGAGDVAAVGAGVRDVDAVDGQDADGLGGVGQSFAVGLRVLPAAGLGVENLCLGAHVLGLLQVDRLMLVYLFAGVRPLDVHAGVELHQRGAVQGEGLPHHQLHGALRKQLDIVNLTSCTGTEKPGEVEVSGASFLSGPEEVAFLWSRRRTPRMCPAVMEDSRAEHRDDMKALCRDTGWWRPSPWWPGGVTAPPALGVEVAPGSSDAAAVGRRRRGVLSPSEGRAEGPHSTYEEPPGSVQ